jgi:hypothetical protein
VTHVDTMSAHDLEPAEQADLGTHEEYRQYKALSATAVASLVLGLASAFAALDWMLLIVPVLGILLGLLAMRQVKARASELTGGKLARSGVIFSVVFLIASFSFLSYEHATEVPKDHERISYDELQPDPDNPSEVLPPSATELDRHKVFIKGYVYPSKDMIGIRQFVLCRDKGDCCFGGNPKLTDRILVNLTGDLQLQYTPKQYRVAGTFHVEPGRVDGLGGGVVYRLDADYLK